MLKIVFDDVVRDYVNLGGIFKESRLVLMSVSVVIKRESVVYWYSI